MTTPADRTRSTLALAGLVIALAACGKAPPAPPPVLPDAAMPANTSDMDVTTSVKTALLRDKQLQGLDITVVTLKGDVRLTGVVGSQSQIDRALEVARATEGTHAIHDELTLKK